MSYVREQQLYSAEFFTKHWPSIGPHLGGGEFFPTEHKEDATSQMLDCASIDGYQKLPSGGIQFLALRVMHQGFPTFTLRLSQTGYETEYDKFLRVGASRTARPHWIITADDSFVVDIYGDWSKREIRPFELADWRAVRFDDLYKWVVAHGPRPYLRSERLTEWTDSDPMFVAAWMHAMMSDGVEVIRMAR